METGEGRLRLAYSGRLAGHREFRKGISFQISVQGQLPGSAVSRAAGLEGSTRRSLGDRAGPRLGRGGRAACAKLRNLGFILRAACS